MSSPDRPPFPDRFTLGPWQADASLDTVSRTGHRHKLEPRSMRLLVVPARAGRGSVPADPLLDEVRPGLVVTPSSSYDAIAPLRKVPGPDHVATVAPEGYRSMTPVQPWPAGPHRDRARHDADLREACLIVGDARCAFDEASRGQAGSADRAGDAGGLADGLMSAKRPPSPMRASRSRAGGRHGAVRPHCHRPPTALISAAVLKRIMST
jgi:DNA-binding winged helix-turn-helix (wHTH) protein